MTSTCVHLITIVIGVHDRNRTCIIQFRKLIRVLSGHMDKLVSRKGTPPHISLFTGRLSNRPSTHLNLVVLIGTDPTTSTMSMWHSTIELQDYNLVVKVRIELTPFFFMREAHIPSMLLHRCLDSPTVNSVHVYTCVAIS